MIIKSALDSPYNNAISSRHLFKSKTYYFLDPKHESTADPYLLLLGFLLFYGRPPFTFLPYSIPANIVFYSTPKALKTASLGSA